MSFYDEVMRELLAAFGGALFVGNVLALLRRRSSGAPASDLTHAPKGRSILYAVVGFIVMIWGIASIVSG